MVTGSTITALVYHNVHTPTGPGPPDRSPVWPYGLALNGLLGAAGLAVAVRRLRVPQRTLPRGTRVA